MLLSLCMLGSSANGFILPKESGSTLFIKLPGLKDSHGVNKAGQPIPTVIGIDPFSNEEKNLGSEENENAYEAVLNPFTGDLFKNVLAGNFILLIFSLRVYLTVPLYILFHSWKTFPDWVFTITKFNR
jgi:hypothetical protein